MSTERERNRHLTLGDFLKELIDDAADSVATLQREGQRLIELKQRADFGLRVLGDVAKTEIEATFDRIAGQIHQLTTATTGGKDRK